MSDVLAGVEIHVLILFRVLAGHSTTMFDSRDQTVLDALVGVGQFDAVRRIVVGAPHRDGGDAKVSARSGPNGISVIKLTNISA